MTLQVSISSSSPTEIACDLLVIGVAEGEAPGALAEALGAPLARAVQREEFAGKKDQTLEFSPHGTIPAERVLLFGLGKATVGDVEARLLAARAARTAQAGKVKSLALVLPASGHERAAAEGVVLGSYRFSKYLTGDRLPKVGLEKVELLASAAPTKAQRDAVALGKKVGDAAVMSVVASRIRG